MGRTQFNPSYLLITPQNTKMIIILHTRKQRPREVKELAQGGREKEQRGSGVMLGQGSGPCEGREPGSRRLDRAWPLGGFAPGQTSRVSGKGGEEGGEGLFESRFAGPLSLCSLPAMCLRLIPPAR